MKNMYVFILCVSIFVCCKAHEINTAGRFESAVVYYGNFSELRDYALSPEIFLRTKDSTKCLTLRDSAVLEKLFYRIRINSAKETNTTIDRHVDTYVAVILTDGSKQDSVFLSRLPDNTILVNQTFCEDTALYHTIVNQLIDSGKVNPKTLLWMDLLE